jgi:hypothetical protein
MSNKFPFRRRLWAAIHIPQPHQQSYILRVLPETSHVVSLYEKYRNEQGYLSKREIETLGIWPPCGSRVRLTPFELSPYIFYDHVDEDLKKEIK